MIEAGDGCRVYFAGDTDLFPGMEEAIGPTDLSLLPVWGWGPTLGEGHLDPRAAAEAARRLRPRVAVPIHWGTFFPMGLKRMRPDRLTGPAARVRGLHRGARPRGRRARARAGRGDRHRRRIGVGVVAERGQPAAHHPVQALRPDDGLAPGRRSFDGNSTNGNDCAPPIPPCDPTRSSNAATSSDSGQ